MKNEEKMFDSFGLNPTILAALKKKGYSKPSPIQQQSIGPLLEGRDLLGVAQTGTGKTAAFTLPILHNFKATKKKVQGARMRCLILTPTRELASQIHQSLNDYGKGLSLKTALLFGGVGKRPQIEQMSRGPEFLVATPGRLIDLMDEGHVLFDQLEVFVLDEADRMLDMGFFRDVSKIIKRLPKKRQSLLFSATMPDNIIELSKKILINPIKVEVTPQATTVEKIKQSINFVEKSNKPLLLKSILKSQPHAKAIIFSRTKYGADRIVKHLLRDDISSAAIHGNKSQGARENALSSFKNGKVRTLVATDIAARGIDIPEVSHIINYDMPNDPDSYVHRIGRTARAGRKGVAISFCDDTELAKLKAVEKIIKMKIPVDDSHPFHGAAPHVAKKTPTKAPQKTSTKKRRKRT